MTFKELGKLVTEAQEKPEQFARSVNDLTNQERVAVRKILEDLKVPAPRNLYYNYQTQQWINEITNNESRN